MPDQPTPENRASLVARLRISRTYVRGPGDVGYDDLGEHDKHGGKPVGNVENERREAADEIERLTTLLNTPLFDDFTEAVKLEAAHQIERWGTVHDRAKELPDWFWLLGYLSGKCLRSCIDGNRQKALHHTISSAAVLLNWHAAIIGADTRMQPGSSDVQRAVEKAFGSDETNPARGDGDADLF